MKLTLPNHNQPLSDDQMQPSFLTQPLSRRQLLGRSSAVGAGLLAASVLGPRLVLGQGIESTAEGDLPTTGGMRPGPVGLEPPAVVQPGVRPLAMQIEKIAVDAEIEEIGIVRGVMENPTGPWVVSWYRETGKLGQTNANAVMAGHVDYWNVGPAVFWGLKDPGLVEGDLITVYGEDEAAYTYSVEWQRLYIVAELTPETINEIVGQDLGYEALTLITCGGEFDYATGEYLSRIGVRARLVTE